MSRNRSRRSPKTDTRRPDGYVVLGTYACGSRSARLLAVKGRVVLFDTVAIAQQFLPYLGMGRRTCFSPDGESVHWLPLDMTGINRADIITGYDPYDVPVGMPEGIRSESRRHEWRHHVMFSEAFTDCGQMVRKSDGTVVNTALEK